LTSPPSSPLDPATVGNISAPSNLPFPSTHALDVSLSLITKANTAVTTDTVDSCTELAIPPRHPSAADRATSSEATTPAVLLSSMLIYDTAPQPYTAPLSALSLLSHAPSSTEHSAQSPNIVNRTTTSETAAPVVLLSSMLTHGPDPHPAPFSALHLLPHATSSNEQPANSETPNPPLALTLTEISLL
jgi:hypothetical protein